MRDPLLPGKVGYELVGPGRGRRIVGAGSTSTRSLLINEGELETDPISPARPSWARTSAPGAPVIKRTSRPRHPVRMADSIPQSIDLRCSILAQDLNIDPMFRRRGAHHRGACNIPVRLSLHRRRSKIETRK